MKTGCWIYYLRKPFNMKTNYEVSHQFWLLLSLVLFLILPIPAVLFPDAFHFIFTIAYSLMVICGIQVVADGKQRHRILILILGALSFILVWISFLNTSSYLLACAKTMSLFAFFNYLSFLLFGKIDRNKEVNLQVIFGAISGYILLGLIGGLFFQGLELVLPGSFNITYTGYNLHDLNYFSFVTLTTLGFGDILPLNKASQALVILLGIAGQLYLTILVAMLVGKYLSRKT